MPVEFNEQISVSDEVFKLSLVDDSELEIGLALNQIESTISSKYIKQLFVLEKRINILFKSSNISRANIPMGANSICWILKNTLNESNLSLLTKSSLLKALRVLLRDDLKEVYDHINDLFVEAKILPNIQFKPKKSKKSKNKAKKEEKSAKNNTSESTGQNQAPRPGTEGHLVSSIFDLMNQNKPPETNETKQIDNKILDSSLKNLKDLPIDSIGVNNLDKIKEILLETIQNDTGIYSPTLSQNQENSIDMMSHFYDHVKKDNSVDNNITASLDAVNLPLIRVAISDQEFFSNEEHPAREYLEKLIQASQQWHGTSVIEDLQKFSVNIANEFEGDSEPFKEANQNIDDYLNVTQRRSLNSEKKHVNAAKGKEKLQSSRQIVSEAIKELSNLDTPEFVEDVINSIIQDSLTLCLLRHGEDSKQWLNQLESYSHLVKMTNSTYNKEISPKQKIESLHRLDQTMDDLGFSKNDRMKNH